MARPQRIQDQAEPPFTSDETFPSEADLFPSETRTSPVIIEVPTNDDWESEFLPENPPAADAPAQGSRRKSVFAYDPALLRDPIAPTESAAPNNWRPYDLPPPGRVRSGARIVNALVVFAVLVSIAIFGARAVIWKDVPAARPEAAITQAESSELPPTTPPVASPQPPGVQTQIVNRPASSPDDNSKNSRPSVTSAKSGQAPRSNPGTAASNLTTPGPAGAKTAMVKPPAALPPPPALSEGTVVPQLPPTRGSLSAPPLVAASPAVTPAPTSPVPASAPAAGPEPRDTAAVQALLARYRSAFGALDVTAVKAIWPTVNARSLENAFGQLQTQEFAFDDCQIDVSGRQASASCHGTARFVPRVGSRDPRVESRRWTFHLFRAGDAWVLERVESR